jgi:hypothetical protein
VTAGTGQTVWRSVSCGRGRCRHAFDVILPDGSSWDLIHNQDGTHTLTVSAWPPIVASAESTRPASVPARPAAVAGSDESDHRLVVGLWWAAQILAVWSGAGFALATTIAPDAINMGIGVGFFVPIVTGLAIAAQRHLL